MKFLIFSVLLIFVKKIDGNSNYKKPCVTPNGIKGTCTEITSCLKIYKEGYKFKNYYERSRCGSRYGVKLVCCGDEIGFKYECGQSYEPITHVRRKRIIGGWEVTNDEYPWIVVLKYNVTNNDSKPYKCAGNLINSQFVLTAAHCVDDKLYDVELRDMMHMRHDTKKILKTIVHEGYDRSRNSPYDIALLKIQKVYFSKTMRWICLPSANFSTNEDYVIAGYGNSDTGEKIFTKQRSAFVPKSTLNLCNYKNDYSNIEYSNIICTGGDYGDACQGDSGGPLMARVVNSSRFILAGIISRCADSGRLPSVYIRVTTFLPWIETNMLSLL